MLCATSPGIQCLLHLKGTAGMQQIPTRKSHHFLPSQKTTRWKTEKYSFPIGYFLILQGTEPCYESFHNKVKWEKNRNRLFQRKAKTYLLVWLTSRKHLRPDLQKNSFKHIPWPGSYATVTLQTEITTESWSLCVFALAETWAHQQTVAPCPIRASHLDLHSSVWFLLGEDSTQKVEWRSQWVRMAEAESSGIWESCNKSHYWDQTVLFPF